MVYFTIFAIFPIIFLTQQKGWTVAPTNRVEMLKKHRPEVSFEVKDDTTKKSIFSKKQNQEHVDETPLKTAKEMRELLNKLSDKREHIRKKGVKVMDTEEEIVQKIHNHHKTTDNQHRHRTMEFGKAQAGNIELGITPDDDDNSAGGKNEKEMTSQELLDSLIKKMRNLGPRGRKIIEMLQKEAAYSAEEREKGISTETDSVQGSTTANPVSDERIARVLRNRRDLIMKTALSVELNSDDETENLAKEEGFVPDGHADHHKVLNETTLNDRSDSEIWSSFSSSEEALLECPGLIMSLPLTPSSKCVKGRGQEQLREEFSPNTITFT